ncbi:ribosome biogenesis factor YjgA [Agaribacter flavus]|uniref:Dual-action ribosomal maturation protein DarP n=1 Tax=Agaribacter flavus TaxID=1902781 RepID=A0ABV7FNJ7_9ALTE
MNHFEEPTDDDIEYVSKTQLKKEAEDLKKLGLALLDLTPGQFAKIPLDDELTEALTLAAKINRKKEGFRRQIQYIGKLLRKADVAPIELALNKLRSAHQEDVNKFHQLEVWRDKLIQEGDTEIQAFLNEYPEGDRQKLRHLVRTANKENSQNKPPAAARELFKYLRSLSESK